MAACAGFEQCSIYRRAGGICVPGALQEFLCDLRIDFDPGNPAAGKIIGVVKMDSAKTGDAERDATLLEEDWFDPQNHPESRFESERIEQLDDGTFAAHGQLTIIGNSQPVTMSFEFEVEVRIRLHIFPAALISNAWILVLVGKRPTGSTTKSPFR